MPFVVLVAARYGRRSRPSLQEVQQRIAELTADVEENVSGVRVVKAFAAEPRQLERFRGSVTRVFDQSMDATRLRGLLQPVHRLPAEPRPGRDPARSAAARSSTGTLTLGDFTAFYAYLLMLIAPMRQLGIALGLAQRATASGARLFELLDREPRLVAPADARPLPGGRGRVELRDVTFAYENAAAPSLRDVSLVVEAGSTVALVGAHGLGQVDARAADRAPLRPDVGLGAGRRRRRARARPRRAAALDRRRRRRPVPVLGDRARQHRLRAAGGDAARRSCAAAERAQAAGFIAELPDGYDTRVGERGLTLSGGQRQRLAIARALLADPRILVLDDATSSVDATTEQAIKEALREVMAGRTTFVIAHRLSTIALADEIVVLEDGAVDRARHARRAARRARPLYAEIADEGPAGPGVPQPRPDRACRRSLNSPTGTWPSCAAGCARRAAAGASCAGCSSCCAPTAGARC